MPHAKKCASLWYHLVPWVLCRVDDSIANPSITVYTRNNEARWVVFQKCIHGFALQKKAENTPPPEVFDSSKNITSTSAVGKAIVDENKVIVDDNHKVESVAKETAKNSLSESGDANTKPPAKKTKREAGVGIKHFKFNRIRLFSHQLYLDTYHCLVIVPILTVDGVKNWHDTKCLRHSCPSTYIHIRILFGWQNLSELTAWT